jgi:hypothetical protein
MPSDVSVAVAVDGFAVLAGGPAMGKMENSGTVETAVVTGVRVTYGVMNTIGVFRRSSRRTASACIV